MSYVSGIGFLGSGSGSYGLKYSQEHFHTLFELVWLASSRDMSHFGLLRVKYSGVVCELSIRYHLARLRI